MNASDPLVTHAIVEGVPCMLMRGGTSKGAFFLAETLPADVSGRDDLLLRIMGSPDDRQIDGIGGAHPLTSKVAVVSRSVDRDADVDYLFLQVGVDTGSVSALQTCGNLLAGVGCFAVERGLVLPHETTTVVRVRLVNTGDIATISFPTPGGVVDYAGTEAIDGVPGTAARIEIDLMPAAPLLPTGHVVDELDGHLATIVDNGMPVVLLRAEEFGVSGDEAPAVLEVRRELREGIERARLAAGMLLGLGDVSAQTIPKMILVSPPRAGGSISTRAFIPSRVHPSIGVLMAASVAAGIKIPAAIGSELATVAEGGVVHIEHPGGTFAAVVGVERDADGSWRGSSVSIRTARKLFDGTVYPRP